MKKLFYALVIFVCAAIHSPTFAKEPMNNPQLRMTTNMGVIEFELDAKNAPMTTQNFIKYADAGFYNGTIFHRVIPGFMIQGGGFLPGMKEKPTNPPIQNEADNGLKNLAGTI
ncbi:MAG: peptidylprolyl isomerase, partial [Gammaproteobacteria bacterium]|nr:peptidylprolyl isomerase [Gammaproteobacteria bacterium]